MDQAARHCHQCVCCTHQDRDSVWKPPELIIIFGGLTASIPADLGKGTLRGGKGGCSAVASRDESCAHAHTHLSICPGNGSLLSWSPRFFRKVPV